MAGRARRPNELLSDLTAIVTLSRGCETLMTGVENHYHKVRSFVQYWVLALLLAKSEQYFVSCCVILHALFSPLLFYSTLLDSPVLSSFFSYSHMLPTISIHIPQTRLYLLLLFLLLIWWSLPSRHSSLFSSFLLYCSLSYSPLHSFPLLSSTLLSSLLISSPLLYPPLLSSTLLSSPLFSSLPSPSLLYLPLHFSSTLFFSALLPSTLHSMSTSIVTTSCFIPHRRIP